MGFLRAEAAASKAIHLGLTMVGSKNVKCGKLNIRDNLDEGGSILQVHIVDSRDNDSDPID